MISNALAQGRLVKNCECLLVINHPLRDPSTLLSYIELSKLLCKAVLLSLEDIGEAMCRKFFTEGSHNRRSILITLQTRPFLEQESHINVKPRLYFPP